MALMELLPMPWPIRQGPAPPPPPRPRLGPDVPPLVLLLDRREAEVRALMASLHQLLDPAEAQRLGRLRLAADRERFLLARGALRLILGDWLGRDPAGLRLGAGPWGKPHLLAAATTDAAAGDPSAPRFNVSHSGDLILLGFHASREVGVDVEQLRPVPEWEAIARRCLPPAEQEAIRTLPEQRRNDAFLAAWCHLEAGLKARGLGLFGTGAAAGAGGGEGEAAGEGEPAGGQEPAAALWSVALPSGYRGAAALA